MRVVYSLSPICDMGISQGSCGLLRARGTLVDKPEERLPFS